MHASGPGLCLPVAKNSCIYSYEQRKSAISTREREQHFWETSPLGILPALKLPGTQK